MNVWSQIQSENMLSLRRFRSTGLASFITLAPYSLYQATPPPIGVIICYCFQARKSQMNETSLLKQRSCNSHMKFAIEYIFTKDKTRKCLGECSQKGKKEKIDTLKNNIGLNVFYFGIIGNHEYAHNPAD